MTTKASSSTKAQMSTTEHERTFVEEKAKKMTKRSTSKKKFFTQKLGQYKAKETAKKKPLKK